MNITNIQIIPIYINTQIKYYEIFKNKHGLFILHINFIWVYLYWISINYKNKTGYCISKLACSQTQRERETYTFGVLKRLRDWRP